MRPPSRRRRDLLATLATAATAGLAGCGLGGDGGTTATGAAPGDAATTTAGPDGTDPTGTASPGTTTVEAAATVRIVATYPDGEGGTVSRTLIEPGDVARLGTVTADDPRRPRRSR